jgi:hypothetical protein
MTVGALLDIGRRLQATLELKGECINCEKPYRAVSGTPQFEEPGVNSGLCPPCILKLERWGWVRQHRKAG